MTTEEKLKMALEALERIASWDWSSMLQYTEMDKEAYDDLLNAEKVFERLNKKA